MGEKDGPRAGAAFNANEPMKKETKPFPLDQRLENVCCINRELSRYREADGGGLERAGRESMKAFCV